MTGDSNNPFRRKGPSSANPPAISVPDFPGAHTSSIGAGSASSAADHYFDEALEPASSSVPTSASSSELFKQQLQSLPKSAQAPPSTTFQKPKPVKKVRVQSPPPSSPEESAFDADFEARFPPDPDNSTAGFALHHPPQSDSESDESEVAADDDPIIGRRGSSAPPIQRFSDEGTGVTDRYADGLAGREGRDPHGLEQQQQASSAASGRTPPNPFQRTLGDLEQQYKDGTAGGTAAAASPASKAPLDVDAFRRLLMTGQSGAAANSHGYHQHQQHANSAHPSLAHHQADAASITDASSISRQSISDERSSSGHPATETPRTSHEISEPEGEEDQHGLLSSYTTQPPRTTSRKKPAPPASRRGKLIRVGLGKDSSNGADQTRLDDAGLASPTGSPTDLNKPLPPAPRQQVDDFRESVFDREAAGKIPEVDIDPDAPEADIPTPRPPTPPNASHSTTGPVPVPASPAQPQGSLVSRFSISATRKPAPPPRRQAHGRSDSRATITSTSSLSSPTMTAYPPCSTLEENQIAGADQGHERKVSSESVRSRASSVRTSGAAPPAPPPPRRPNNIAAPPRRPSQGPGPSPPPGGLSGTPSPAASQGVVMTSGHEDERIPNPPITPPTAGASIKNNSTPSPSNSVRKSMVMPPPPPPARHYSVRSGGGGGRPASIRSVDSTSRRVEPRENGSTSATGPPPPPPPPRPRGRVGSRTGGSTADSSKRDSNSGVVTPGGAENILADLDALQREVDALRGQMA